MGQADGADANDRLRHTGLQTPDVSLRAVQHTEKLSLSKPQRHVVGQRYTSTVSLTPQCVQVASQLYTPAALPRGEIPRCNAINWTQLAPNRIHQRILVNLWTSLGAVIAL